MTTFAEKLAAAKSKPRPTIDAEVSLNGELTTIRFTELPGDVWADIADRCPVRIDSPVDMHYGYNMNMACKLAAPLSGELVDEAELSPADWEDLFAVLSGRGVTVIADAIYKLNVYLPDQRVSALKKASEAATASVTTSN